MPWNDNAGPGPWGSPPPNDGKKDADRNRGEEPRPGAPKDTGGPPPPVDLSAIAERVVARLRQIFNGPGRPRAIAVSALVLVALWGLSGCYVVQPKDQAVVTTFGAYSRTASPGLRYHLPYPIEHAEMVPFTSTQSLDIGGSAGQPVPDERLMLTGDENIVDLSFTVQWRVSDAAKYSFNVYDPPSVIKDVAESAMREVVGKTALTPILTNSRGQVQDQTRRLMQQILDRYDMGVAIQSVNIQTATTPAPVLEAYRDVQRAAQNAQSAANNARGEAAQITQAALGYREQVVREAAGDAARFNQVYEQYKLAPAVTRERLYIETMQRVLERSNKVIVDNKGANAPIILPSDTFRPRTSTAITTASEEAAR
ncbi:FtsH protease activity modulator HflK [Caulobacter sp. BK020]|uniref:FtsH protease activity modulator HflK n=1 Tax=Caulobacter sp. BK020 TaxID=2512117 RepID=UPI001048AB9B|nr:FtsH protease activity modulator HflK [Caulobacter sp. BK020]TCS02909.1 protease FtsH subunit HflK [Caulobacter sp. BK020]